MYKEEANRMSALFEAIKNVVESGIMGNCLELGLSIVDVVAAAVQLPINLVATILRILGYI